MASSATDSSSQVEHKADRGSISAIPERQPLFLSPWEPRLRDHVLSNKLHFRPETSASVLTMTRSEMTWTADVSDDILHGMFGRLGITQETACAGNVHVVIFVYLEKEPEAEFDRRISLSDKGLKKLVEHVDMATSLVSSSCIASSSSGYIAS
ncbi:hypothetical protein BP6252_10220 [Coleophoma cylindrospora]|uniref:Uncharacterized protein n=1 Tax=Coleophoma cylindrospora TaxID=1849047 RepID=A0A3D8QXU5_9HELO|nr:hypothetical protein BP6252_10220 [Coleophoma cylindrospora]